MHELSIATSLIESADRAARAAGARRVEALHLRLGALSGVVRHALEFAYDLAAEGTLLEGSRLVVEEVPVAVRCPSCDRVRELPGLRFRCPACDTPTPDVVRGREIEISHLEVEPGPHAPAGDGAAAAPPLRPGPTPSMPLPPWRR